MNNNIQDRSGWFFRGLAVPLVWLLLGLSGAAWGQAKVDVARSEWMKGYVKLEQADKAGQEANKLAALQLYREAVAVFQEVRRKYPQWNPSLLNYRLNYCQQKIKQLEEELQGEATTMDRDKLLELTARQAKLLHENAEQIRELNTTIGILNEAIRRARTEAATVSASESELQGLREARGQLEDQCRLLELKLGKAQEEMEGLRKKLPDKDSTVLRHELKQAAGQLKELQGQLADQQKKLQATGAELGRSQAELSRLQKDQKEQSERLAAANQRIKELADAGNALSGRLQAAQLRGDQQVVEIGLHKESLQRMGREKQEMLAEMTTLRGFRDKYILSQESARQLNERLGELENRLRERDEVVKFAEQAHAAGKRTAETLQGDNARLQQELAAKSRLCETLEQDRRRIMQDMQQQLARERQGWQEKEQAFAAERQGWQEKEQAFAAERQGWQEREKSRRDQTATPPAVGEAGQGGEPTAELLRLRQALADGLAREKLLQEQLAAGHKDGAGTARLVQELEQARRDKEGEAAMIGRLQQELAEQREKAAGLSERGVRQAERIEAMTAELQAQAAVFQRDLASVQRDLQASRQTLADTLQANQRLEAQLQPLREAQKELVALAQVLKEREAALAERNVELQRQAESLAAANALVLARQDAAQSAQVELQAVQRRYAQLETQHAQLNEHVQALQRRYGDFEKNSGDMRGLLATSQQREQEMQRALQDMRQQLEARTQLAVKLEQAVADLERAKAEATEQVKKEESLRLQLAEELNRARSKSEAVDGITSNYLELQASLAASGRDAQALRQQIQAAQTETATLRAQLERREEQIRQLHARSSTDVTKAEQLWLASLAELNTKLESEENRRKALELALIQRESAEPAAAASPVQVPPALTAGGGQEMGKYLREQEVVLQGFLRQGVEAERNKKIEAARWNYSRVLELQPGNLLALKRMGLLAANHGDDQGAVNYLKQAFRLDPDDQEILLALGYAMVSLGQPEWALANLGRAMALNPDNATISRLFGVALVNMGWTQAAEQQFMRTLTLAPKDPESAFNLAVLCLTAKPSRLTEARKWYDQAVNHGAERDPRLEEAFK